MNRPKGRKPGDSSGGRRNLRPWWDRGWVKALALIGAVLLSYQPIGQAGFIWDDNAHLTSNSCVVGPLGLADIWTTKAARICPMTLSSFWAQHKLWGLRPLPYHLVTLLMHAAAGLALWRALVVLKIPWAWLGAALWTLHPVQVESAAWITELKNTQSGLFFMLTGLCFVKARRAEQSQDKRRAQRMDWAALACAFMAMASKSSTVILPLVLGLCAWWMERGWRWRNVFRLIPYCVLSALTSALSLWTQGMDCAQGPGWARSWPERAITAGQVVWFYLGKLAWPDPLIFIYPKWNINAGRVLAYLPLLLALAALMILWLGRKRWGRSSFMAFAYFVAALLPVLGVLNHYFLRYSFVGDHFQYLAGVGPVVLVAVGIGRLIEWAARGHRRVAVVCTGLLLGGTGMLTRQHAGVFRDNQTLWQDTLAKNPDCWLVHCNLAAEFAQQGKLDEAIEHYQQAIRLEPDYPEAYCGLGNQLAAKEELSEAISHYERALQLEPDYLEAHNNLAVQLARQGSLIQAIPHWERALQLDPSYAEAEFNLGLTLARVGKIAEATRHFQRALTLATDSAKPGLVANCRAQLERYRSTSPDPASP